MKPRKVEIWSVMTWVFLGLFALFLIYPMFGILKQAVFNAEGSFSLAQFEKFFSTLTTPRPSSTASRSPWPSRR